VTLTARIALKWGQIDRATAIISKIYSKASPEQIDLKVSYVADISERSKAYPHTQVKVLQAAVKQSIEITRTTTFWQRLHSILFVPVNRRALSEFDSCKPYCVFLIHMHSCRLWHASISTTVRVQYPDVLLCDAI
jgi:hypothetical protein